jgi:hypothetical protein
VGPPGGQSPPPPPSHEPTLAARVRVWGVLAPPCMPPSPLSLASLAGPLGATLVVPFKRGILFFIYIYLFNSTN